MLLPFAIVLHYLATSIAVDAASVRRLPSSKDSSMPILRSQARALSDSSSLSSLPSIRSTKSQPEIRSTSAWNPPAWYLPAWIPPQSPRKKKHHGHHHTSANHTSTNHTSANPPSTNPPSANPPTYPPSANPPSTKTPSSNATGSSGNGKAEGFAAGVTGGGSAARGTPTDIKQLATWLTDSVPRVIVLDKVYDFIGSQGSVTATGCKARTNTCGSRGQDAINKAKWCDSSSNSAGPTQVTYDVAATQPIDLASDKTLVGVGSSGVIKGKGLRISGAKNIIIQNIKIMELNPQYIWGGDAIELAGTDEVWIDHCTFQNIGREMIVTGTQPSGRVTISNNHFDGRTANSASCDGHHYWTLLLYGSNDQVTLKGNYFQSVSGRAPKVVGDTVLHAVNNLWDDNGGHAFDVGSGSNVVAEGNIFEDVKVPLLAGLSGNLLTDGGTACVAKLGHVCVANTLTSSGSFQADNQAALNAFTQGSAASSKAMTANDIRRSAGFGAM